MPSWLTTAYAIAKEWQTLIAGLVAIFAAWLTVRATLKAATLQANASLRAATMMIEEERRKARQTYEERRYAFARAVSADVEEVRTATGKIRAEDLFSEQVPFIPRATLDAIKLREPVNFETRWDELGLLDTSVQRALGELLAVIKDYNVAVENAPGNIGAPQVLSSDLAAVEAAVDRAKKALEMSLELDAKATAALVNPSDLEHSQRGADRTLRSRDYPETPP